jgi:UDP-glucuronate 4-epimerase
VRDRERMSSPCIAEHNITAVAHLAAMAGVRNAIEQPGFIRQCQSERHAERARRGAGHRRCGQHRARLYLVGLRQHGPRSPSSRPISCDRPLQPYAAAKRAAEILGYSYHHLFGQNFTTLRFFTVYGPNGRPDMMAYLLADSVMKGKRIPLYDNGQMYRDWTFVDDTVSRHRGRSRPAAGLRDYQSGPR